MITISGLTILPEGTDAEWAALTVPIPDGVLVYATDTKLIKRGNGSLLYSALPIYMEKQPIGTIVQFPLSYKTGIPAEYLYCDGSTLSTTSYVDLFNAIGYDYGGSGTSFDLPTIADTTTFANFIRYK